MSILGKLAKGIIDIATLPIDVVKDVATLGGVNTDKEEPYTWSKLKKIQKDGEDIYNELD